MSNWPVFALGDVVRIYSGGTPDKGNSTYWDGDVPWASPKDMRRLRLHDTEDHVSEAAIGSGTRSVDAGTILIVVRSMILARELPIAVAQRRSCFNQDLKAVVPNELLDNGYLLYWLLAHRHEILGIVDEAGHGTKRLQSDRFLSLPICLPPLETQQRIAAILGAYDDLIEVNRRRVAVLEEMARGLFEEWFVRFRFPGHETVPILDTPDGPLPEGWRWENLYDTAEVSFGFAFKSKAFTTERIGVPVVRIRDVQEGRTSTWTPEAFDDRYWVKNGDLLIGMDGIFHTNIWVGGDAALNQRVTRLRPKDGLSVGWLFGCVLPKIKFFEATIRGTTVAHLGAKHLKTIMLPRADEATQRRADAFFAPIDAQLVNLKVANERLAASRDLLLPRLISSKLSVETAERELEAAA